MTMKKMKFLFIFSLFFIISGCAEHKHLNTKNPCNCPNNNDKPRYKKHSFMDNPNRKNISNIAVSLIS